MSTNTKNVATNEDFIGQFLARTKSIKETFAALDRNRSVVVTGPDNTGKSIFLDQLYITNSNIESSKYLLRSLELVRGNRLGRTDVILKHCFQKLADSIPDITAWHCDLSIENLCQFSKQVEQYTGKTLCLLVDDLYRFADQWDRYEIAKQVFDTIVQNPRVRWVVADNAWHAGFSNSFSEFSQVKIGFFNKKETKTLVEYNIPKLEKMISKRFRVNDLSTLVNLLYQTSKGCPYQLTGILDHLSSAKDLNEIPLLLERFIGSVDPTVLKVMDYVSYRGRTLSWLIGNAVDGATNPMDADDALNDRDAKLLLISTGAFKQRGTHKEKLNLQATNLIFRRQFLNLFKKTPAKRSPRDLNLRELKSAILDCPITELRDLLSRGIAKGMDETLLAHLSTRRIEREPDHNVINSLVRAVLGLFDFERVSLFICEGQSGQRNGLGPKRITLSCVMGQSADEFRENSDELGWAVELGANEWLRSIIENRRMTYFCDPFEDFGIEVWGSTTELKLGECWRRILNDSQTMVAIPIWDDRNARAVGIIVADQAQQEVDHRQLWSIWRMASELSNAVKASATDAVLRSLKSRNYDARRLLAGLNDRQAENPLDELKQICSLLQDSLDADYVDVCKLEPENGPWKNNSRYQRLAKTCSESFGEIGQKFSSFPCDFRESAANQQGTWKISNNPNDAPVVPRHFPPKQAKVDGEKPILVTSVGSVCGGGFETNRKLAEEFLSLYRFQDVIESGVFDEPKYFPNQQSLRLHFQDILESFNRVFLIEPLISYFVGLPVAEVSTETHKKEFSKLVHEFGYSSEFVVGSGTDVLTYYTEPKNVESLLGKYRSSSVMTNLVKNLVVRVRLGESHESRKGRDKRLYKLIPGMAVESGLGYIVTKGLAMGFFSGFALGENASEPFDNRKYFSTKVDLEDFLRGTLRQHDKKIIHEHLVEFFGNETIQRPYGIMTIGFSKRRLLSSSNLLLIDLASGMAGTMLAKIKERSAIVDLIRRAAHALARQEELEDGLRAFVDVVADELDFDHGRVTLHYTNKRKVVAETKRNTKRKLPEDCDFQGFADFIVDQKLATKIEAVAGDQSRLVEFFRPEHGFDSAQQFVSQDPSINHRHAIRAFLEQIQGLRSFPFNYYLGIPIPDTSSNHNERVIGCMEFWIFGNKNGCEREILTNERAQNCVEVAKLITPAIAISQEREEYSKGKVAAETARLRLQGQVTQYRQMNHDLVTPITRMDFALNSLKHLLNKSEIHDEMIAEQLALMDNGLTHLASLTELWDEVKDIRTNLSVFDLGHWLSKYVKTARSIAQSKKSEWSGLAIEFEEPKNSVEVRFDKVHLERILDNLIKNAFEAKADKVNIQVQQLDNTISVHVVDNGMGVAKNDLAKIWNPYHSTKSVSGGLGLSIVRALIQANQASTFIESDDNCTKIGFEISQE